MDYISLIENNCKHCHRCVANCPTNAISFINKTPEIIPDQCILCGECFVVCPQHAKSIHSDFDVVNGWIKQGLKVHVSLAPSFVALLKSESTMKHSLLAMGFASVEETSIGAAEVSEHYRKLSKQSTKNIITTCCPVVVSLIEKYYPHLVDQLAPVVSPMRAHGKKIKAEHPNDKVVFVGPCIAKIKEAHEHDEIDAVLTFDEILAFLQEDIETGSLFTSSFKNDKARQYPTSGGILSTLVGLEDEVDSMVVDGIEHVKDCCQAISDHEITGVFIEMSACVGSCLNGPMIQKDTQKKWKAKQVIEKENKIKKWTDCIPNPNYSWVYKQQTIEHETFSQQQIDDVLKNIGKFSLEDQLNCQACGYTTCVEKAIAVLEGKADPELCLPYALSQAQSMSNLILHHTPNGIVVVDEEGIIIEINPAARRSLKTTNQMAVGESIFLFLPSEQLKQTLDSLVEVEYFMEDYPMLERVFDHACIPIEGTTYRLIILMDLTMKINEEKQLQEHRNQSIAITQKIIDEQMMVVQEIAGLLGESSAKSKIALETLKKSLKGSL